MEVKILSLNTQVLVAIKKRLDIFNYLKSKQCQIYCLQDIYSTVANENCIRCQWGNKCIFSSGPSNARGIAILFNKGFEYKIHSYKSCPRGNYIIVDLTVDNNRFILISLFGPNTDSP